MRRRTFVLLGRGREERQEMEKKSNQRVDGIQEEE